MFIISLLDSPTANPPYSIPNKKLFTYLTWFITFQSSTRQLEYYITPVVRPVQSFVLRSWLRITFLCPCACPFAVLSLSFHRMCLSHDNNLILISVFSIDSFYLFAIKSQLFVARKDIITDVNPQGRGKENASDRLVCYTRRPLCIRRRGLSFVRNDWRTGHTRVVNRN